MSSMTISVPAGESDRLRPLNVTRDLSAVADLIELCFHKTMDSEGQRYIQQMRRASQDSRFLRWAVNAIETTSLPLSGYVWEEKNRIVGNISLVPFNKNKQRIYLIANVAVHPDYRRRGIAHILTQKGLEHARRRQVDSVWLHVQDHNLGAIKLYADLGFQERARRTTWAAASTPTLARDSRRVAVTPRRPHFWPQQHDWLQRVYPDEITWYRMPDWDVFGTGVRYWLHRLFVESNIRQWAAQKDGQLQAVVSWMPAHGRTTPLWLAAAPDADEEALSALLLHARRHLITQRRSLFIDYPAGEMAAAIEAAGFQPHRTLVWMRADGTA
ncbi:MAG: GNAT family N-acetyltransferase [Chloroflexi bacterium]|nr:GNAT family N-acetyltransferase [Chloroflexota bacterium]